MATILLLDDDIKLANSLVQYFAQFGLTLTTLHHPSGLWQLLPNLDLLILDVMLPDEDGFSICKRIRQTSTLPIIMLTARGDVTDKVVGFELGADDYLAKPFEPRELVARTQRLLRKQQRPSQEPKSTENSYRFNELTVQWCRRRVFLEQHEVDLTSMEFELLKLLIENKQIILSRDEILNRIKGIDAELFTRSVDILISRLRSKLNDDKENLRFIKTIWGRGYCFIGS